MVHAAALRARHALTWLSGDPADRAEGLSVLEDGAVSLAAVAVRAALNLELYGASRPAGREQPLQRALELQRIAGEISASARRLSRSFGPGDAGLWLGRCLSRTPPLKQIQRAEEADSDRSLRVDALLGVRASWIHLGALELLLITELAELQDVPQHAHPAELRGGGARRAEKVLGRCYLDNRPDAFAHDLAWQHQTLVLADVVASLCLALDKGYHRHLESARARVLTRLSRVVLAVWTIDARLGCGEGEE